MRTSVFVCSILTASLISVISTARSQAPAADVVAEVISFARERSINSPNVDWPRVEREARDVEKANPGEPGRTLAIRQVVAALSDGHSYYLPPRRQPSSSASGSTSEATRAAQSARERPPIAMSFLNAPYGRLKINSWMGDQAEIFEAAQLVRSELRKALALNTCGLVIDLSSNQGGNMWPMMGGITPSYSEGLLLQFIDRGGKTRKVEVQAGTLSIDQQPYTGFEQLPPIDGADTPYIAVVVGDRTASSGEITAVGFKGQSKVRFFGHPTAGKTTVNSSRRLSNGGMLALATSKLADREGNVYEGPLLPEVESSDALGDAYSWLAEKCGGKKAESH